MPKTDYDSIAPRFDEDRRHWDIPIESGLEKVIGESDQPICVLDLGCGTGNWLATQSSRLNRPKVSWLGVDPSASMIAIAHRKVPFAGLAVARAERIPLVSASCAYVSINFAFHHFDDKERGLDEISRVLRPDGGLVSIYTPQPNEMREQWVYKFFEGTWELDQQRFWSAEQITEALERRGFHVTQEWERFKATRTFQEILRRAQLRVISELADLGEDAYQRGLDMIRSLASDPDALYETESAMLRVEATRAAGKIQLSPTDLR